MGGVVKTVRLHRAQDINGREPVESLTIVVQEPVPERDLAYSRMVYESDARMLADRLFKALPGGTVDALLRELLLRRALMLSVPLIAPGE